MFPRDDDTMKISGFKYQYSGGFEGDNRAYAFFTVGDEVINTLPLSIEDMEAISSSLTIVNPRSDSRDYDRQRFFLEKVRKELNEASSDVERFQNIISPQSVLTHDAA